MKNNKAILYVNNGIELYHKDLFDMALSSYKKAIPLLPFDELGILYYNMGLCHFSKYNYPQAEICFNKSFNLYGHKSSGYELSMTYLFNKKIQEGLDLYNFRLYGDRNTMPDLPLKKVKTLEDLKGKKILVLNEQGLGDEFLFSRSISLLKDCSGVSYQVYPELEKLYNESLKRDNIEFFTSRTLSIEFVKQFDYWTITGDLFVLYTQKFGFDFLKIEQPKLFEKKENEKHIGIVYRANPKSKNYKSRSIEIEFLKNLFYNKGYIIHNLQKDEQIDWMVNHEIDDFKTTSGLIQSMDFVISVDTSVVHLCGILDKKCYLIYNEYLDWRWNYEFYKSIELIHIDNLIEKI